MTKWLGLALCAFAMLVVGCGGGAGSSSSLPINQPSDQPPTQSPTSNPTSTAVPQAVVIQPGGINGSPGLFVPARGDTSAGGQGQTVDGIPCTPTMAQNAFHIHSFLGVIVNGGYVAIPDSIGMQNPGPPANGFVDAATCFYYIHTHDQSGTIHQESPSASPLSASLYTLGNVLDVWGQPLTADSFANFTGLVRVFTGTVPLGTSKVTSYTEFTGDPRTISLYSHEAVWIEVGAPYVEASALPPVTFYTQY